MLDPAAETFKNSRREAWVVWIVWFFALIWTVGYCYLNGYSHAADCWLVKNGIADVRPAAITQHRFGMPMWICYGIVAPAIVCSVFTFLFGFFGMKDDALGLEKEEAQS
ncbi:MAG: hypothetical protein K8T89_14810 [Planctomycetes bacterium]|nr:hypothetical protein [Planctomycetota bacterium]